MSEDEAVAQPSMLESLRPTIQKAIPYLPKEVRFRAENAYEGFRRAKLLLPVDREIASFRAITAEEEAAATLFRSLQLRKYPGSEYLSVRQHQHKAAAGFFLNAVTYALVGRGSIDLRLTLTIDPPAVQIALPLNQFTSLKDAPERFHVVLAEPLGIFSQKEGVAANEHFDEAVAKVAGDRNVNKLIDGAANSRNKILYAHDSGVPASKVTMESIKAREQLADLFILLAIAVLQVETHQAMALQCLSGFLKVLGRPQPEVFT